MSVLAALKAELDAAHQAGGSAGICEEIENETRAAGFCLFARTRSGWLRSTANIYLRVFPDGAALAVLSEGNYKDEGSAVAAAILVVELHKRLGPNPVNDWAGVFDEAATAANRRINETARADSNSLDIKNLNDTVMGARSNLEGIGACFAAAAVFPSGEVVIAHLGDCRASALSPDGVRHLTSDHTLASEIAAGRVELDHPAPEHIVTRALGFREGAPELGGARSVLEPNECLVLSSSLARFAVRDEMATSLPKGAQPRMIANHLIDSVDQKDAPVGVVVVTGQFPPV